MQRSQDISGADLAMQSIEDRWVCDEMRYLGHCRRLSQTCVNFPLLCPHGHDGHVLSPGVADRCLILQVPWKHIQKEPKNLEKSAEEDGRQLAAAGSACFDAILLDAPCSGEGNLRRIPEVGILGSWGFGHQRERSCAAILNSQMGSQGATNRFFQAHDN